VQRVVSPLVTGLSSMRHVQRPIGLDRADGTYTSSQEKQIYSNIYHRYRTEAFTLIRACSPQPASRRLVSGASRRGGSKRSIKEDPLGQMLNSPLFIAWSLGQGQSCGTLNIVLALRKKANHAAPLAPQDRDNLGYQTSAPS
jgi:hypothetical protein